MGADIAAFQEVEAGHPFTGASDFGSFLGSASSSGLCARPSRFGSHSGCDFYYGAILAEQRLFFKSVVGWQWRAIQGLLTGKVGESISKPYASLHALCGRS